MENYSNAYGYGFWCGVRCARTKMAAGIPPLGAKRAFKATDAQADLILAKAALQQTAAKKDEWSPTAVAGVVGASLLGIALMVVIIKKAKK